MSFVYWNITPVISLKSTYVSEKIVGFILLRNVDRLSTDYMAVYPSR
jgi:hypothetical protein